MKSFIGRSIAAAGLLALTAVSVASEPQTILYAPFESAPLEGWNVSGNTPEITAEVARAGRHAIKSVVDYYNSPIPYRTEVRAVAQQPEKGKEYWYGFSVYLPKGHVPDTRWEILAQFHQAPDEGEAWPNPPLNLAIEGSEWIVRSKYDADALTVNKSYDGGNTWRLGSYATGRWTDWVFRVKWSYESDGLIQVWKDGELIVDSKGPNCYNNQKMPFFKMGIYKGWRTGKLGTVTRRVVYHDEFRMVGPGGSYEDVAPGRAAVNDRPRAPSGLILERLP